MNTNHVQLRVAHYLLGTQTRKEVGFKGELIMTNDSNFGL